MVTARVKDDIELRRTAVARHMFKGHTYGQIKELLAGEGYDVSVRTIQEDIKELYSRDTGSLDEFKVTKTNLFGMLSERLIAHIDFDEIPPGQRIDLLMKLTDRQARYMGIDRPTTQKAKSQTADALRMLADAVESEPTNE